MVPGVSIRSDDAILLSLADFLLWLELEFIDLSISDNFTWEELESNDSRISGQFLAIAKPSFFFFDVFFFDYIFLSTYFLIDLSGEFFFGDLFGDFDLR